MTDSIPSSSKPSMSMSSELPAAPNTTVPAVREPAGSALVSQNPTGARKRPAKSRSTKAATDGVKKTKAASADDNGDGSGGGQRAKSGCYTCRIRRKKCDETINESGACQTCVRLRLQCLGFGPKRPEWLRSPQNVTDLRNRIKDFLASQGMIKGHANPGRGGGPLGPPELGGPSTTQNPNFDFEIMPQPAQPIMSSLSLGDAPDVSAQRDGNNGNTPIPSREGPGFRTIATSSIRESDVAVLDPALAGASSSTTPARHDSAEAGEQNPQSPGGPFTTQSFGSDLPTASSSRVVQSTLPNSPFSMPGIHAAELQLADQDWVPPPHMSQRSGVGSQLPSHFEAPYSFDDEESQAMDHAIVQFPNATVRYSQSGAMTANFHSQPVYLPPQIYRTMPLDFIDDYKQNLLQLQFLMGDPTAIRGIIFQTLHPDSVATKAALLIGSIAYTKRCEPDNPNPLTHNLQNREKMKELCSNVGTKQTNAISQEAALAALMAISVLLFAGGQFTRTPPSGSTLVPRASAGRSVYSADGLDYLPWIQTLQQYATQLLGNGVDLRPVLASCGPVDQFIIKTAIWFDVISSISSPSGPQLASFIRGLLDPRLDDFARQSEFSPSSGSESSGFSSQTVVQQNSADGMYTHGLPYEHYGIPAYPSASSSHLPLALHSFPGPSAQGSQIPSPIEGKPAPYFTHISESYQDYPSFPSSSYAHPPSCEPLSQSQYYPHPTSHQTPFLPPPAISMIDIMGATSTTVWSIAETTSLQLWKESLASSKLSYYDLALRAKPIHDALHNDISDPPAYGLFHVEHGNSTQTGQWDVARRMACEAFREAAKLYLASVVESDRIEVSSIQQAARSTLYALRAATSACNDPGSRTSIPVIRSLYFPVFICGAFTYDGVERNEIRGMLMNGGGEAAENIIGNARSVLNVLSRLWQEQEVAYMRKSAIPWRSVLRNSQSLLI